MMSEAQRSMESMISQQIEARGVHTPSVLDAMRRVPREIFVPGEQRRDAYEDCPLPIGEGQTVSQPYIVALMTEALDVRPHDRVLEIGTGSGYQTAVLARLAQRVFTVERIESLAQTARKHLQQLQIDNVEFRVGDGTLGWPEEAPFDRIIITAAGPDIPRRMLQEQLADGGVAVLPAGEEDWQRLWRVTRQGSELLTHELCGCRFVRLIGDEGWDH